MSLAMKRCAVCNGNLHIDLFECPELDVYHGRLFAYGKCRSCGILVLQNCADQTAAHVDYSASGYYAKEEARGSTVFNWVIDLYVGYLLRITCLAIEEPSVADKSILDVGCGKGRFLERSRNQGAKVTGVEPTARSFTEAHARLGDSVLNSVMSKELFPPDSFDVITMWHVFEHMPDPLAILEVCSGVLKPKGKLIIAVPNYNGWVARLGGCHWFNLDPPRHEVHYDPASLGKVLARSGFHATRVLYFYPELTYLSAFQTLLNKLPISKNFLFNYLKRNSKGLPDSTFVLVKDMLLTGVIGLCIAIPVFVTVPFISLFRASDCITVIAEKT